MPLTFLFFADLGETHRGYIAQRVYLALQDLAQDAPHNLAAPSLGQVRHHRYGAGRGKRPNVLTHLHDKLLVECGRALVAILD